MKSELAEYIYTTVLRPYPLRKIVNFLILSILPEKIIKNGCTVYINRKDPVISGALLFGVFETEEAGYILDQLQEGDVFIDIGANVGYYTAIAMNKVKNKGLVISFEPDPESYLCLQKTVEAGNYDNALIFNYALSDREGKRQLYLNLENRGDNRLHAFNDASKQVEITTINLDAFVKRMGIDFSNKNILMKIDVQGSEGLVLAGARDTIKGAKNLTLLMEFWPEGLRSMGTDPKRLLEEIESFGLGLYQLKHGGVLRKIADKDKLIHENVGRKYINILGLRIPVSVI